MHGVLMLCSGDRIGIISRLCPEVTVDRWVILNVGKIV